jgi:hypothetical protein
MSAVLGVPHAEWAKLSATFTTDRFGAVNSVDLLHCNSNVTLSIPPVNLNGSLYEKSTAEPTSRPSLSEIRLGMVLGSRPAATLAPLTDRAVLS